MKRKYVGTHHRNEFPVITRHERTYQELEKDNTGECKTAESPRVSSPVPIDPNPSLEIIVVIIIQSAKGLCRKGVIVDRHGCLFLDGIGVILFEICGIFLIAV